MTATTETSLKEIQFLADCPCCGAPNAETVFAPDASAWERFLELSRNTYGGIMDGWRNSLSLTIRRCCICGHLWHADCPDQDNLFYMYAAAAARKASTLTSTNINNIPGPVWRHIGALSRLAPRRKNARIRFLDYGSGYGLWARAAQMMEFDVYGFEPVASRQKAEQRGASTAQIASALDELKPGGYDIINLEQVLEHVPHPVETLRELRRIGAQNCIIRISVPDVHSGTAPGFWDSFPYDGRQHILSPYEHLQGFNYASLHQAIARAGIKEIDIFSLLRADLRHGSRRFLASIIPSLKSTTLFGRFAN